MPEGHSVHRIARQFRRQFIDAGPVGVTSPQGRFAADATLLDGHAIVSADALGKQMFLRFEHELWLRVHLGMYGAWDFAGDVAMDDSTASAGGRMGQTNQRGTVVGAAVTGERGISANARPRVDGAFEDSPWSIGAPRRTRLRMSEETRSLGADGIEGMPTPGDPEWPPAPIGQVRARLLTPRTVADLRGPTACEVLDEEAVARVVAKLGPDPMVEPSFARRFGLPRGKAAAQRFVDRAGSSSRAIGLLLVDQEVVAGIGNVYRAEMLFRARLSPFIAGRALSESVLRELWQDWVKLLRIGVETGQMLTMDGLRGGARAAALANRADRHWVYHRAGLPCRVCETPISMELAAARKLYWCPNCQAA